MGMYIVYYEISCEFKSESNELFCYLELIKYIYEHFMFSVQYIWIKLQQWMVCDGYH